MRRRSILVGLLSVVASVSTTLAARDASAADLAPPPPMSPTSPTTGDPLATDTHRQLDAAEQKDSGRHFELVWADVSAGASYVDMQQLSGSDFALSRSRAGGPAFSVGAGVRLVLFVLGARLRYNPLSAFDLWQVNAEAGIKLPVSSFDILFGVHGGYSFAGRLDDAGIVSPIATPASADSLSVRGANAGLDVAVDYYVTPLFSVGAGILGDVLFLGRSQADKPAGMASLPAADQAAVNGSPLYSKSGSGVGLQLAGGLRLGLHFGL